MATNLRMKIKKVKSRKISIEIDKEDFETFCNACGLFKKEFLDLLDASEKDHQEGKITERDSLRELIQEQ